MNNNLNNWHDQFCYNLVCRIGRHPQYINSEIVRNYFKNKKANVITYPDFIILSNGEILFY